jgi:hypothetical protein
VSNSSRKCLQNKKLMVNGKDMSAIVQQLISPPSPVPTIKAR